MPTERLPDTMNAAALDRFGGPEQLRPQRVPVPEPDPHEVLIRVHTAGIGVWDAAEREGTLAERMDVEPVFPYVPGTDGSGTVVAVGSDVERFAAGDRVFATAYLNPKGGFYAEYAAVEADRVARIPDGLSMEEAGVMPADAVTALRGLRDVLKLRAEEVVAVFGASGGVGHMAVQLAHRLGARVYGVASGDDGVDLVRELGADAVTEGHDDDLTEPLARLAPNGLDAVLVTAWGERLPALLDGVHEGGRVAWPNGVHPVPEPPRGVEGEAYDGMADREIVDALTRLIDEGPFQVHVDEVFSLDRAADAHRRLDEHYLGKLALHI